MSTVNFIWGKIHLPDPFPEGVERSFLFCFHRNKHGRQLFSFLPRPGLVSHAAPVKQLKFPVGWVPGVTFQENIRYVSLILHKSSLHRGLALSQEGKPACSLLRPSRPGAPSLNYNRFLFRDWKMHWELLFFLKLEPISFLIVGHWHSVCPKGECCTGSMKNHQDPVWAGFMDLCNQPSCSMLCYPGLKTPNPFEHGALDPQIM